MLLALPLLPIIHFSVQRWRGVHPTVITGRGAGLHPDMRPALALGFLLFTGLVVLLIGYHHMCGSLMKKFQRDENQRSHIWYRYFNEVPTLLLIAVVLLVVLKPF